MRVSEVYRSIQGEGPHVGVPTIFVRFAGCNLRCPGWPCDTQWAIDPSKYRHEWQNMEPAELVLKVLEVAGINGEINVCLTGGEPMLQNNAELDEFVTLLRLSPKVDGIEMFSNGSLPYTEQILDYVDIVMDWKLPGSGEDLSKSARNFNVQQLGRTDAIKFTIADRLDYVTAYAAWQNIKNPKVRYYYGKVWNRVTDAQLINWALLDGVPWIHTMQVHNIIWDRTQRGI